MKHNFLWGYLTLHLLPCIYFLAVNCILVLDLQLSEFGSEIGSFMQ